MDIGTTRVSELKERDTGHSHDRTLSSSPKYLFPLTQSQRVTFPSIQTMIIDRGREGVIDSPEGGGESGVH